MKPTIGIPQMGNDLFRKYMKSKYASSLIRAGAQVKWIELEDPEKAAAEILNCDGLLLPGGADVAPHLYGQTPTDKCGKPNTLRDVGEMKILEAFFPTGKPVFCICRGVQLLNVFCGGTLHQDIKGIQKYNHADFKTRAKGCHQISITDGTKLASVFGSSAFVNSMHHQALDTGADNLTVSARSLDGFVEAVEHSCHPFCVGVQWHPEHMSKHYAPQQQLFDLFVSACK